MSIPAWLAPGSTIKRWLLIFVSGLLIISLGIGYLLADLYRHYHFPTWADPFIYNITLQFIPRGLRGALFMLLGVTAIVLALNHLNRVIVAVMSPMGRASSTGTSVIGKVHRHRLLLRGPRVVAIGGGTGMSLLLRGLRAHSRNLSVVVTVADDGGSSGRLRRELGILPPGDFRQCIAALADVEPLMAELLQYRFERGSGLEGHTFGNLFIAAMAAIHDGSFEKGLAESSRVLAVQGRILPSTLQHVTLGAELLDRSRLEGESVVAKGRSPIERVFLIPEAPEANPDAVEAIRAADVIVVGPGSLYTSIMPNLLVPGIPEAIAASRAPLKVFVCNVATEPGETDGYTAVDFVQAIERHVGCQIFDYVITNSNAHANRPGVWKSQVVKTGPKAALADRLHIIEHDVVDDHNALRHDPQKLAQLILRLVDGRRRAPDRSGALRRVPSIVRDETFVEVLVGDDDLVAGQR